MLNPMMKSVFLAAAVLGTATACQNAAAAEGYEISGQLKNAPAGTVLHLSELTSNQFVEKNQTKTDIFCDAEFVFYGRWITANLARGGLQQCG